MSRKVVARLRNTPLLTTTCDLHQPIVLPHLTLAQPPTIIIVKLCLEFAATSAQQVRTIIKGLAGMIGETVSETMFHVEVCKDGVFHWRKFAPKNEFEENSQSNSFRAWTVGADGGSWGDLLLTCQPGDGHREDDDDVQSFSDNLDQNLGVPCRLVEQGTA